MPLFHHSKTLSRYSLAYDLRKAQHGSVSKTTVNEYIWGFFKKVQKMKKPEDREKLMLHMIGDFKSFSLNPRSVNFKPKAKPKGKALFLIS